MRTVLTVAAALIFSYNYAFAQVDGVIGYCASSREAKISVYEGGKITFSSDRVWYVLQSLQHDKGQHFDFVYSGNRHESREFKGAIVISIYDLSRQSDGFDLTKCPVRLAKTPVKSAAPRIRGEITDLIGYCADYPTSHVTVKDGSRLVFRSRNDRGVRYVLQTKYNNGVQHIDLVHQIKPRGSPTEVLQESFTIVGNFEPSWEQMSRQPSKDIPKLSEICTMGKPRRAPLK